MRRPAVGRPAAAQSLRRALLRVPLPVLGSLGRNPLLLYTLHSVLGLAVLALFPADSRAWVAWAAALVVLGSCTVVAVRLDRRRLFLKL